MILWKIFSFEFNYLVRRISTWLYLTVLLLFTATMNGLVTPGDGVYTNNTFHIIGITVMGGLIWLVMGASIAGEAAARDVKMRMDPLTFTTPVKKRNYLGGRFLAALTVNALLMISLPLGVLLSFYFPGIDQGEMLPFRFWAYGSVCLWIVLPNAFIITALQFSLAALTRQVMTSYLVSLLLAIVAQVIAMAVAKLFGNWDLVKLLDPVGVTGIIGSELATWTPTEKNTRLVTLEGLFLWNRIMWLGIATGLLWFSYSRFSFTNPVTNHWWGRFKWKAKTQPDAAEKTSVKPTAISVLPVERSFGFATYFHQTLTIAWASFTKIARHPVGLTLVGVVALISALFGYRIMTQFEIPLFPTTQQVLDYLTNPVGHLGTPWVVIPLLILYFTSELLWQERDAGLSDVADAAPVPDWVLFTGKFLGMCFIILAWTVLMMAGGLGMQVGLDYHKFEIGLYWQTLFGLQIIDYMLFALLAFVVHVVVNQKYISYLVMLLVFLFMAFPATFKVEHHMLIFGADPGWQYTDMRGFGSTRLPFLWFKIYWFAWALLLAVAARLLWARGREKGWRYRVRALKLRFTSPTIWVAAIGVVLLFTSGSFVLYNTNVLNKYRSSTDVNELKAAYERRFKQYKNTLQPQLKATKLHVELYPEKQQVEIRSEYKLVNDNAVSIDTILLSSALGISPTAVKFNRGAMPLCIDKELGFQMYKLNQPLQPGDSLKLNFIVNDEQHGFSNNGTKNWVVKGGSYFTNYDLLPALGYQPSRELSDPMVRKEFKLVARPAIPSLYDVEARNKRGLSDQNTFEATVGTTKDEIAIAPGALLTSWREGNRQYFHYKTDAPIGREVSILSAKYLVHESKWNEVAIRIYYHPGHAQNIGRMLRSVKASLAYFTEQFGPYPSGYITLVERAGNGGGATADAGIIYFGEQYALMHPDDSPAGFDLPYYILAHEVAHQWWGMARLTPAPVEGAGVLIEGLAVYAGMQVLEMNYGDSHLRQYVNYLHASYEMPRSLATPSLLQANESFLYYRKGGLALYALSKYIGKEKVNRALKALLQKRSLGEVLLPTTLDLFQELQNLTPDSLHYLLNDLFKQNTYWRLKTKNLAVAKTKDNNWQATLKVQAQKVVIDLAGTEKEVPMNDWLEVGIYEEGKGFNEPLYLQMHKIRSGEQVIKVIVPRKPQSGGIDPNFLMIDLRIDDNIISLDGG